MNKLFICIVFTMLFSCITVEAIYQTSYYGTGSRYNVGATPARTNIVKVLPQSRPVSRVSIHEPTNCVITPKLPPPVRQIYHYKDFSENRQFPRRSYYIPSYCLPVSRFYNNNFNPFCAQYMPYGNSMYLRF